MKRLSQDQIDKLFKFVRSKYVPYIDLQCEIVDHLASDIEVLQDENPDLNFDQALKKVYAKFPITGFSNLKAEKEKAMHNYWMRRMFKYYLSYFKLPKIILTIFLFILLFVSFDRTGLLGAYIFFFVIWIIKMILVYKHLKRFSNIAKEKYLIISAYMSNVRIFGGSSILTALYISYLDKLDIFAPLNLPSVILLAFLGSIYLISIPAIIFHMPEMLKQELSQKYAHLNITFT